MDWFLYDRDLRHEGVKKSFSLLGSSKAALRITGTRMRDTKKKQNHDFSRF